MNPHIAFFGSSLLSAYWNGAATYYRGILGTLHKLRYSITFYEPDAFDRQQHRDIAPPEYARVVVYPAELRAMEHCLADAAGADIVVKASGVGVFDSELEAGVAALRGSGRQVIFWDVDAPATLERMHADPQDPFRALVPQYDRILTYGGGEPVVHAYEALGANECTPIYNAFDPATHHPVPADPRFHCDLAFLGNRLPDREARVEELFLTVAEQLPQLRFILGGSGWGDKRMPHNVRYVGHVGTADHNAFNCSARAILNISRDSMASYGFSPATRVFEAAAAGACMITDHWSGIAEFFEPGEEILVARTAGDIVEHLRQLDMPRARQIGRAARKRALANHTYTHRSLLLEQVLLQKTALPS
jgi:spore maturation protein CgeB